MIFSKCPRCRSNRIRRGYRRTPFHWRIFGRYHLLCNACNWEFEGWAVPGTVESAAARRRKKRAEGKQQQALETIEESNELVEDTEEAKEIVEEVVEPTTNASGNLRRVKHKKRVRIKLNK